MKRINYCLSLPIFFVSAIASANAADLASGAFDDKIKPLLEEHCFQCHDEKKLKGGIDLSEFDSAESMLRKHKLWKRVVEAVRNEEMPPDDDDFTSEQRTVLLGEAIGVLAMLDSDLPMMIDPGPSPVRRLSRDEYNFVMRDLTELVMDFSEQLGMPEDSTGSRYTNVSAALNLPPTLLEKYFAAADLALVRLFAEPDLAWESAPDWARKPNKRQVEEARERFFAELAEDADRDTTAGFVSKFMRKAWRRPVAPAETARLMTLYDLALTKGDTSRAALRKTLKPILVAPDFLFRVEQNGTTGTVSKVSDIELASRLSFFLWSSIPDEELLTSELSRPDVLESQVKRMLADERAKRLTEGFFLRWLEADKITQARPRTEFFPAFNDEMKRTMRAEVEMFCEYLRLEDRPILDLLKSDYTFVNSDLAKLYGIGGVESKELQLVSLKPEHHRGGVLGMGAVLSATSHTNRTSPTKRGNWVLGVILGTPPPPPPANASMFKDEDQNKKEPKDFREKLARHASDATCAGCHAKMDPLGFGLDNYNAIGEWRPTTDELDTSGVLPGGEKISGADGLAEILWKRRDQFVRNVTGQFLAYALGRELDYFDEGQITRITQAAEPDGYKFSTLVLSIAKSYPFQHRRNAESN
jgi:hypothetical protein